MFPVSGVSAAACRRDLFDSREQRAKETLALYRGQTCGVRSAEAVRSVNAYAVGVL